NLLQLFPEQAGAIDAFFNGGLRQMSIRATTSCVFRYAPPTRPINLFLLAEEDRKKILDMEAEARTAAAAIVNKKLNANAAGEAAAQSADADDQTAALSRVILQDGEEELLDLESDLDGAANLDGSISLPIVGFQVDENGKLKSETRRN